MKKISEEQNSFINSKIKLLKYIWIALVVEMAIDFLIAYYVIAPEELAESTDIQSQYLLYFSYFSVIIFIPLSFFIYSKIKEKDNENLDISAKFQKYRTAMFVKYTLFALAGTFSTIVFLIAERLEPLSMFAMTLVILLISKPSAFIFRKDYGLESKEDLYINPKYEKTFFFDPDYRAEKNVDEKTDL